MRTQILETANYSNGYGKGNFLKGDVRIAYDKKLDSVEFDDRPKAIKQFLEDHGFEVKTYGEKSTHHYAETTCGIYLSSNGYIVKR